MSNDPEAFTLAKVLDSEFIKDELTSKEDEEFRDGLLKEDCP